MGKQEEWRVVERTRHSTLKQKWVRLRSGLWAPTERFMCDAQMMSPIMGGSPGVVDKQVGASGDDGRRYTGTGGFSNSVTAVYVGYDPGPAFLHCHIFARWIGVTYEGTVDVSYIEAFAMYGQGTPELNIYGVDEDNPAAPTSAAEFDADPLTTAFTPWDGVWTSGVWERSPSCNGWLQELVDTHGPFTDTAIMAQVKNDHGVMGSDELNGCHNYEWSGNLDGLKLHIEYRVPTARRIFITQQ